MEPVERPLPVHSILVVEDDQEILKLLMRMLATSFPDIALHSAGNGRDGLDLFKEHAPEIVVTDIHLPVMDGIQMAEEIRSIKPDTKFIVLTGFSADKYMEKFSELGVCDYIVKPILYGNLVGSINKCIEEIGAGGK